MQSRHIEADFIDRPVAPRRLAPRWLALNLFLLGATAPAIGAELGDLKRISGPSPFAGCTADDVAGQDGVNYPNTEIEPYIDANPDRPRNLIAVWQQDRWSNGGSRGNASAYSTDRGRTWTTVTAPKVTRCTGGKFTRASDPWVSFSPNGNAYFMHLAFDPDLPSGAFGRNAMLVSRSTNGGRSWSDPITLVENGPGQILHDKNSLTADPNNSRYVYAVWDRLRDFTLPPAARRPGAPAVRTATSGDGVAAARQRIRQLKGMAASAGAGAAPGAQQPADIFFEGPIFFTRTTNGGASWEPARETYNPGPNAQTINNLIEVTPRGTLFNFFTEITPNGGTRIRYLKSFDNGRTFSGPATAAVIATTFGSVTPDTQELVRDAAILFDTAVDPRNGNLYLVWQDVRFTGFDEIAFAMSTDRGSSWSTPVRINRTPRNDDNELRQQAIVPSIEVGEDGKLVVTYYDYRFDRHDSREATDYFAVFCNSRHRNCAYRSNWGDEERLTNRSFDMLNAPVANGYFLGDYMGLTASGNSVLPAFGIADGPDLTSVFTRRIRLEGHHHR